MQLFPKGKIFSNSLPSCKFTVNFKYFQRNDDPHN